MKDDMPHQVGDDGIVFVPPEVIARDPAAVIAEVRGKCPFLRMDPMRVLALRAADVVALGSDARRAVQVPGASYVRALNMPAGEVADFLSSTMLMSNGPEHLRRRGAFVRTFAHPAIRARRDAIRAVADRVMADLPRGETFDFRDLAASRLPAEMIAEVLGLASADSKWFAEQVYSFSRCLSPPYDLAIHDEVEAAAVALRDYVEKVLDERRAAPRDDLLSILVNDDSARALEPSELVHQVMTVILAGSDTTRAGLTILVSLLLEDRSRWEAVEADEALVGAAIDEALRLDPPVGTLPRFAPAPIEIDGATAAAGQVVGLSSYSAMRDGTRFADPESFDMARTDHLKPHLVFGAGAHRCLGEMLARIELEEGLKSLIATAPGIQLVEPARMQGYSGIRRVTPLMLRIPA